MADSESDLETDGLELALEALCNRHCSAESSLNSKYYCSEFCELVEEYTGQWQVPLPQLKVLRTALTSFTKATAAFPEDCQHIHYVLSSLALSFFELMLFFSKEEFLEDPLKDILDSFQECHYQLLRHRNIYLQHVKQIIKEGGPWENPVLQGVLKDAHLAPKEVEAYLSSELPIFLELRIRYLQACERMQEAMALAKSCLENREVGKHLYFHQAYLTCLYKASLHEHLLKEIAEIDGRDAVEIICNTESVEKDDLLLSLCNTFLTQQLNSGDMYYIWDLVFIWSRLHLRAHPSRQGFLAECLELASSATNVRAIFPFIKLVTTELGAEGVQVGVELCARALQLCDIQADCVTRSLVYKTIAFLLPHDLEICRACALLVFCQERSLEAYRTVCLLYMHPDQEPHPHNSPVRTSVRFHILQMLKERLCFDPEFWNLLTLRTHCLELMSDKVMKAAVLNEMQEEEKENSEELITNMIVNDSCTQCLNSCQCTKVTFVKKEQTVNGKTNECVESNASLNRKNWRRLRRKKQPVSDDEADIGDDPEFKYNLKPTLLDNKTVYSLRRNPTNVESSASVKLPLNRKREYLSRCVKSQIFKRKNQKKRWLQGVSRPEPVQTVKEKVIYKGKKRGRKPLQKLELSYPDNEILLTEEESGFKKESDAVHQEQDMHHLENELELKTEQLDNKLEPNATLEKDNEPENRSDSGSSFTEQTHGASRDISKHSESLVAELQASHPSVDANPELDGPTLELDCSVEMFHNYCLKSKKPDSENLRPSESSASDEVNGDAEQEEEEEEPPSTVKTEAPKNKVNVKRTWKDRILRTQQYSHLTHHCNFCRKLYKGLNVMRHAISHLKNRKLKCILCGKHFKQFNLAKKHILDHIDEMCKQKPPGNEPCAKKTPVSNGVVENQGQDENQNSVTAEQKPGSKSKVSSLRREDRIIRNLRTLIKKTCVLHKKCKNPDANNVRQVDFKDEQVVIKDGLVIIKSPPVVEGEGTEKPEGENGYDMELSYQLCPSDTCDRVFLRIGSTLTKHAIKCHIKEEKVLEKTFNWTKQKCTLCLRQIQNLQQYKDHMRLHYSPLQHFCYHLECKQRFVTPQELKDHVSTHQPFRPQCTFTDCENLFSNLQGLYDHEWRHYVSVPQKKELELGPSRQKEQSIEASWKQRVKVEELWLQNKKPLRQSPTFDHVGDTKVDDLGEMIKTVEDVCKVNAPASGEDLCDEPVNNSRTAVNGHDSVTPNLYEGLSSTSRSRSAMSTPSKRSRRKAPVEWDPLNVRDLEDLSTLAEGVQQKLGEPHITEHKSFKPEDPSYATFVKAPFIRPPPSTYLDESVLSMRKRRSVEESPKKTVYWSHKKKKEPVEEVTQPVEDVVPEQKIRQRCDKCLSSFSSLEELQKHQALNTCSALFGFDSDDES
ncbi:zinc finger protein 654-like [Betta splendens]|uniref:Zinc finger protein 654-like n=1 Tax=Betta splendens TaxID=158456 RepID=A0A6P7LE44_BETSP|nr:zinc finger protein 654-like [Betta splendens]